MIIFGIHCNFFIVLPIRLKICRSNGFFYKTECVHQKTWTCLIGFVSRARPIGIWHAIGPGVLTDTFLNFEISRLLTLLSMESPFTENFFAFVFFIDSWLFFFMILFQKDICINNIVNCLMATLIIAILGFIRTRIILEVFIEKLFC